MITNLADRLKPGQQVYTSGGFDRRTLQITASDVIDVPDLSSNQEEADTRIILHAINAAKQGADTIVVQSPDTDVLVLPIHHRPQIPARKSSF